MTRSIPTKTPLEPLGAVANVKSFGAVGDGVTNDREAIQDAIDWCVAQGGGTVLFPPGDYLVNGTFTDLGGTYAGLLTLPARDLDDTEQITISLVGIVPPAPNIYWGEFGQTQPLSTGGAVIRSTSTPSDPWHAIISCPDGGSWGMTAVHLVLRDLTFRTNGQAMSALDLRRCGQVTAERLLIDNGEVMYGSPAQPASGTFGIAMPAINNWVVSRLTNSDVIQFETGVIFSEHFRGDDIRVFQCVYGIAPDEMNHASWIGKLITVACQRSIRPTAASARLSIGMFATERGNASLGDWRTTVYDIDDANDYWYGRVLSFQPVTSAVGAATNLLINGGSNVSVRHNSAVAAVASPADTSFATNGAWVDNIVTLNIPAGGDYLCVLDALVEVTTTANQGGIELRLVDTAAGIEIPNSLVRVVYYRTACAGIQSAAAVTVPYRFASASTVRLQARVIGNATWTSAWVLSQTKLRLIPQ